MHIAGRFLTALAVIYALILVVSPASAKPRDWQVSESSGPVAVENDGIDRPAHRGLTLKQGDAISTGANGRAVIVRGGEYVIISPKSRVRISKPAEAGAITQIYQYFGSVLFKIQKKQTPHFGVKTPYLAAVVKGTTFNVTVTDKGATVQVTEGRVEVATLDGGAADMIVPGRIARVDGNDRQLLKVLGTNETSIRSPLPVTATGTTKTNESTPSDPETNKPGGSSNDAPTTEAPIKVLGNSEASGDPDSGFFGGGESDGFSGKIGTSMASEPVSIAAITGGLIVTRQQPPLLQDRLTSGNAGNTGGNNAADPVKDNTSGNGNDNPDAAKDPAKDDEGNVGSDDDGDDEDKGSKNSGGSDDDGDDEDKDSKNSGGSDDDGDDEDNDGNGGSYDDDDGDDEDNDGNGGSYDDDGDDEDNDGNGGSDDDGDDD